MTGVRVEESLLVLSPLVERTLYNFPSATSSGSRPNPVVAPRIIELWRDCFDALTFLHDRQMPIIHCDIKPGNIGIRWTSRNGAFLLDFGHAIQAKASFDHGRGTIQFLAPEALSIKHWSKQGDSGGRPDAFDSSVDVWGVALSFATVFWDLGPSPEEAWANNRNMWTHRIKPPVSCRD